MTGTVGIFLAVVAGLLVADRRELTMVVLWPFLAVAAIQTWGLAAGRGVSPPSTVTAFPGAIPYCVVQATILALALGIAWQISALRFGGSAAARRWRYVCNGVVCALVVGLELDRPLLDPGSVAHHSSTGRPPVLGLAGIALLVLVCAGLGCLTLRRRWTARPAWAGHHVHAMVKPLRSLTTATIGGLRWPTWPSPWRSARTRWRRRRRRAGPRNCGRARRGGFDVSRRLVPPRPGSRSGTRRRRCAERAALPVGRPLRRRAAGGVHRRVLRRRALRSVCAREPASPSAR